MLLRGCLSCQSHALLATDKTCWNLKNIQRKGARTEPGINSETFTGRLQLTLKLQPDKQEHLTVITLSTKILIICFFLPVNFKFTYVEIDVLLIGAFVLFHQRVHLIVLNSVLMKIASSFALIPCLTVCMCDTVVFS